MTKTILCIEDESSIRDMLRFSLTRAGYNFTEAENSAQMSDRISEQRPDLILMDWMLPDSSGPDLVKQLRKDPHTRDIPIIMLTAKAEEQNMIQGLESGADDYITKPVSLKSLNARIKALLRRTEPAVTATESISYDAITLNLASQTLVVDDEETPIGATELKLLRYFIQNKERVLSRTQLLDHVWGQNNFVEERTVDVHILRLRKLLKARDVDHLIQTVRGSGYKLSK
ncbi:response regulator [Leucothrix arctica]|uniref:DNA-binding response regulator n=1 Tax=Leucothrix arctica TaxID=1481894 RepID=A0A317CK66_9GAMM|nr:response regulator [Leucothrix arctica]PWQ98571.1 DNA-binding response regulator [Leucothrix arctica]